MNMAYTLCVFALSVLVLGDFVVFNCEAISSLCPVREVLVPATEVEAGFKCVCRQDFFGNNCRFKARNNNSIKADAEWLTNNSALLSHHGRYGESVHILIRLVRYERNGTIVFSKWFRTNVTKVKTEFFANRTNGTFKPGIPAKFTVELRLKNFVNYELYLMRITSGGDVIGSLSIFMDSEKTGLLDTTNTSESQTEKAIKCEWLKCPGQYLRKILADFGKSCFVHGATFAVAITVFGILLNGSLVYLLIRLCKKMKKKRLSMTISKSNLAAEDNGSHEVDMDASVLTLKSFIIDVPVDADNDACVRKEDVESVFLTVHDVINAIRPPSIHWTDEETISESSGSSLTTVTSLSTLDVSSLIDEDFEISMAEA